MPVTAPLGTLPTDRGNFVFLSEQGGCLTDVGISRPGPGNRSLTVAAPLRLC